MGYQHTFYIKRNEEKVKGLSWDLPDDIDNIYYFWFCGCRDLTPYLRRYGKTVKNDEDGQRYEFNSNQLMKFIADILNDIFMEYKLLKAAEVDYRDSVVLNDDEIRADMNAMNSYAIMRAAYKAIDEIDDPRIMDEFDAPYKLDKMITGLVKFAGEMTEDDVLVWVI